MADLKIQIDTDEEKINTPLSKREKMALLLLYIMFKIVYCPKYPHQLHVVDDLLFDKKQ